MRRFNHILGFLAVSFVLVFMSKVNKVGLFSAYIKTIADVEIRNSHQIKSGDAALMAPLAEVSQKASSAFSGPMLAACLKPDLVTPQTNRIPSDQGPCKEVDIPSWGVVLMSVHAPRAPGLA
jgi:hypothetical protein